jgi:hypothetical protein
MRFTLSPKAKDHSMGCYPSLSDSELLQKANGAAIYTHPFATHRNGDILFRIDNGEITGAYVQSLLESKPLSIICPDCENDGGYCETCNSTGFVTVKIKDELLNNVKEDEIVRFTRLQGAERLHG